MPPCASRATVSHQEVPGHRYQSTLPISPLPPSHTRSTTTTPITTATITTTSPTTQEEDKGNQRVSLLTELESKHNQIMAEL